MTQAKHTPGPWSMPDSGQGRISKVGDNGGWDGLVATADCGDFARSRSEGLANARIIAAAPELLEALERLVTEIILSDVDMEYIDSHFMPHIEKARAAITKATGTNQ